MQTSSETGAVRRQRRSLSLTAGELLAKVSESFDRATPDGSALFVMNKEKSTIDAKTLLVLVKDFAYELLFKRLFFVFTNKQLKDQGFKQDLFLEC